MGSLCEVIPHVCTSAATWETARARPVALKSPPLCEKRPKTLSGHPLKPETRPFNSEAHGLTMSYLPDIRSSALQCPLRGITRLSTPPHVVCPKSSRMQPKLERCSSRRSPCFLLLGRSCRQRRGRLLGAPDRLQEMQAEAPTCSCNGRSPKISLKT